jgi:small subunit ribosomal protein S21
MLIIKVTQKGGVEKALKEYKSKVIKTKQLKKLRDRQEFEKPSIKKRQQMMKAKYIQQKFNNS